MAKIAVQTRRAFHFQPSPQPECLAKRSLASGHGWQVSEVVCCSGPQNDPFEEQHSGFSVAIVVQGTFQYRASAGRELMIPGSLLLGNAGQYFECSHEHGVGDRCISFALEPQYFGKLADEANLRLGRTAFSKLRVPPLRELSSITARACAGLSARSRSVQKEQNASWEELGVELAMHSLELATSGLPTSRSAFNAEAGVTRTVRLLDSCPSDEHDLSSLAQEAGLSRYHYIRVFQRLTTITPHQYLRRVRLRNAASRLLLEKVRVLDVALDCGFDDISNFNHAFRAEFGRSPRMWTNGRFW